MACFPLGTRCSNYDSFSKTISRGRFHQIIYNLHLCDNANPDDNDRLFKIRRVLEKMEYLWNFKIYAREDNNTDDPASTNVASEIMDSMLEGYSVYLDNWYSSPDLFIRSLNWSTDSCGTVLLNRRSMLAVLNERENREMCLGGHVQRTCCVQCSSIKSKLSFKMIAGIKSE